MIKRILVAMKLKLMGYVLHSKDKISLDAMRRGCRTCEMVEVLPGKWLRVSITYRIGNDYLTYADVEAMRVLAKIYPDMKDSIKMYEKDAREFI